MPAFSIRPGNDLQLVTPHFPQLPENIADYLQMVEDAGREIVTTQRLSEATQRKLSEYKVLPVDHWQRIVTDLFDSPSQA